MKETVAGHPERAPRLPLLVRGDIDGFFGLFIDNLVQVMVIASLCTLVVNMPASIVYGRILPGAAVSLLVGNLFYAYQARRLARKEGRDDVTALPYGINTPTVFLFVFGIMAPVYHMELDGVTAPTQAQRDAAATLAWHVGLAATFLGGIIEMSGALIGRHIRRFVPRPALMSVLGIVAITFITMHFAPWIWSQPLVAFLPLSIVLIGYVGRVKLPLGLPAGLWAVLVGTAVAWAALLFGKNPANLNPSAINAAQLGFHYPTPAVTEFLAVFDRCMAFLPLIVPLSIMNLIGTLMNLEAAEVSGDRFRTGQTMLVDGVGTVSAAVFGSPFPTTVYIGHSGWKGMGARSGYSWLNGVVMAVLLCAGMVAAVENIIPMAAGAPILIYIGMVICAQAFQTTPQEHMPAVVIGFIPVLAAWGLLIASQYASGLAAAVPGLPAAPTLEAARTAGLDLMGAQLLADGALITSMVLVAIVVFIRDRDFYKAAISSFCGAALTVVGLMHAKLMFDPPTMEANIQLVLMYLAAGCLLLFIHEYTKQKDSPAQRMTTEVWDWDANVKSRPGKN